MATSVEAFGIVEIPNCTFCDRSKLNTILFEVFDLFIASRHRQLKYTNTQCLLRIKTSWS
jgi:hypothetical protein